MSTHLFFNDTVPTGYLRVHFNHRHFVNLCLCTQFQVKDQFGVTPLHEAVKCNHLPVARMLIENGCDVMVTDDEGTLPFHLSCLEGNIALLRLLLAEINQEEITEVSISFP